MAFKRWDSLKHSWAFAAGLDHAARGRPSPERSSPPVLLLSSHSWLVYYSGQAKMLRYERRSILPWRRFSYFGLLGLSMTAQNRWPILANCPSLILAGHKFKERLEGMAASSLQFSARANSITGSFLASLLHRKGMPNRSSACWKHWQLSY